MGQTESLPPAPGATTTATTTINHHQYHHSPTKPWPPSSSPLGPHHLNGGYRSSVLHLSKDNNNTSPIISTTASNRTKTGSKRKKKKKRVLSFSKPGGLPKRSSSSAGRVPRHGSSSGRHSFRSSASRRQFLSQQPGGAVVTTTTASPATYAFYTSSSRRAAPPPPPAAPGEANPPSGAGRLPSTHLRRQRRLSTATSSSVGSHPPVVTVTDYSDADTEEVDFDPDQLWIYNGRSGYPDQRTSTPKSEPRDMDIGVSRYESSSVSETRRKSSASPKEKSAKVTRKKSNVSSASTSSSKSSKKSAKQVRKGSSQIRIKRGLFGSTDPKREAANKWKNIVDEFEEVYSEGQKGAGGKRRSASNKEVRRVNKLANLDQYDNVRQVFSKSMPLPMQMAPPGARVEDIEAAESGASEASSYSWSLMTPMRRSQQQQQQEASGHAQLQIQSESRAMESSSSRSGIVGAVGGMGGTRASQTMGGYQAAASSAQSASSAHAAASSSQQGHRSSSVHEASGSSGRNLQQVAAQRSRSASRQHQQQQEASSRRESRSASKRESRSASRGESRSGSRQESRSGSRQEARSRSASGSASRSASRSWQSMSQSEMRQLQQQNSALAGRAASRRLKVGARNGGKQGSMVSQTVTRETREFQTKGGKAAKAVADKRAKAQQKGVKFRQTHIEKKAAVIVDDVIQNALRLLYGEQRRKSRMNSSSAHSSASASAAQSSSRQSSSSSVKKHIEKHVEKHIHRRSMAQKPQALSHTSHHHRELRSHSVRPVQNSGRQGALRQGGLRPLPARRGSPSSGGEMAGLYDMIIQPHGGEQEVKSEAEMEWYRRMKAGPPRPRDQAGTNTTTSIKVHTLDRPPPVPAYQQDSSVYSRESRRTVVDPPTITRGTVTRVFHELDQQGQVPPGVLLAQLQALHQQQTVTDHYQQPASGDYTQSSMDYSTSTWPLLAPRPDPLPPISLLQERPVSPSSIHYSTLPSGVARCEPWGYSTAVTYNDRPHSAPHSILLGNVPGGYLDDNIPLTSPPQALPPDRSYTMTSFRSHGSDPNLHLHHYQPHGLDPNLHPHHYQPHVDVRVDTGQLLRSLPIVLPSSYQQHDTHSSSRLDDSYLSLPAILDTGEYNSGAYSNEPLIVADLLGKVSPEQPSSGSFYSLDGQPHVNMNRGQVLNFYVFNQKGEKEEALPHITYASRDVQARYRGEEVQYKHIYFGDEDKEIDMPDKKKYTIYHKQTQTIPPPPAKKSPPPKRRSPPRIIEKKERIIKRMAPRPPSPERPRSPVVHKETHHYITKERQIEKLPPPPPPKAEFSVQTDMTGRDWEDEVDSLHRALTTAERRAYDAERAVEEMHASNAAIQSVVREIEEVAYEQERLPTPPPPAKPVREIPVSREIVKVEPKPKPKPEPEPEPEPEKDDESEEEFYEWTEIEEKEQRLSMAIFEEIEFNLQRTQGGTTTNESGKTSEMVPWAMPPKYEAIVDRRRKKMTQVRDIHREGDDVVVQSGNVPALTERSSIDKMLESFGNTSKDELDEPSGGVTEQRDMTLRREQNITEHPAQSKNEVSLEINKGGHESRWPSDIRGASKLERHFTTRDYSPESHYMSTFEHEMGRRRASPSRASGRTSYRSDTHVPLAAHAAMAKHQPKHSTSMYQELAKDSPVDHRDSGESHTTTLTRETTRSGRHQPGGGLSGGGKHSTSLLRDAYLSTGGGVSGGAGGERHHTTAYSREPLTGSRHTGRHSTTYLTDKGSRPLRGGGGHNKQHHVTTYTRQVEAGAVPSTPNSSGYSSADNTSQLRVEKLRGFEIPIGDSFHNHQEESSSTRYLTETDLQLSKPGAGASSTERSKRFVSRFDPGNIYFTVPQWTPVESLKQGAATSEHLMVADNDNDSLPDALPIVEAEHIKRKSVMTKSENQQSPPKVHSELVEDEDGNLMKVTTTEQKMTKRMEYVSEPEPSKSAVSTARKQSDEALVEESFVELDLTTTEHLDDQYSTRDEQEAEQGAGYDQHSEYIQQVSSSSAIGGAIGPEVVSETSVGYKKIEYDDQEKSLGVGVEDLGADILDKKFLYDMKTATLKPVMTRDPKSGELLMQYSLGETMVTEL